MWDFKMQLADKYARMIICVAITSNSTSCPRIETTSILSECKLRDMGEKLVESHITKSLAMDDRYSPFGPNFYRLCSAR